MEMNIRILKNSVLAKAGLILSLILCMQGLCSCDNDSSPDGGLICRDPAGCYFESGFISEVGPEGGVVEVGISSEIPYTAPFVYGTLGELPGYAYAMKEYEEYGGLNYRLVLPLEYDESDIINMDWARAYYPRLYWPIKDTGMKLVYSPTDFAYQWISVSIKKKLVSISVDENTTGTDRRIVLIFSIAPWDSNNVIEMRQRGE